jgi:uncharacterized membrane protein affecting hemolysin expression
VDLKTGVTVIWMKKEKILKNDLLMCLFVFVVYFIFSSLFPLLLSSKRNRDKRNEKLLRRGKETKIYKENKQRKIKKQEKKEEIRYRRISE